MKDQATEIDVVAKRQASALVDLAIASRRVRASAGALPALRAIAEQRLGDREAVAKEWGVLPTQEEIVAERRHWAKGLLLRAYARAIRAERLRSLGAAVDPDLAHGCERAVLDAIVVVREWGLNPAQIIRDAGLWGRR